MKLLVIGLALLAVDTASAWWEFGSTHSHYHKTEPMDEKFEDYYYQPECCNPCDLLNSHHTDYYKKCGRYLEASSYVETCRELLEQDDWKDAMKDLLAEIRFTCFYEFGVVFNFKCPWEKMNLAKGWRFCDDGTDEDEMCFPDPDACDACAAFLNPYSMFYKNCGRYLSKTLLEMWTVWCRYECVIHENIDDIIDVVSAHCHHHNPNWIPDLCKLSEDCEIPDGVVLPFGTEGYVSSDCSKRCDCTDPRNPECEDLPDCDENASCVEDGSGSHQCECNEEYTGDGYTCELINKDCVVDDGITILFGYGGYVTSDCSKSCECKVPQEPLCVDMPACDENASCVSDGTGSHKCDCNEEYTGDGYTCELIDKDCVVGDDETIDFGTEGYMTSDCSESCDCTVPQDPDCQNMPDCDENASCVEDGSGSHQCACNEEYTGDGYTCELIDKDCVVGDEETIAFGTEGYVTSDCSESCDCKVPQDPDCDDITPCDENASCVDDGAGSHKCDCNDLYTGDGYTCELISDDCVLDEDEVIIFETVGYVTSDCLKRCDCTEPKTAECEDMPAPCHSDALCMPINGSHMCICNPATHTGDGYTCFPMEPDCVGRVIDLVFVVDTSISIRAASFIDVINFLKSVTSRLDISEKETHVGFVSFSRIAIIDLALTGKLNTVEVLAAVEEIPHQKSDTNTATGIEHAKKLFADHGRDEAEQVLVVVTDGKSTNQFETAMAMAEFNELCPNVTTIVMGVDVGEFEFDMSELRLIASGCGDDNILLEEDFRDLKKEIDILSKMVCTGVRSPSHINLLIYIPNQPLKWANRLLGVYDLFFDLQFGDCAGKYLWVSTTYDPSFITIMYINGALEVREQYDVFTEFCTQSGTLLAKKTGVTSIHDAVHDDWQVFDPTLIGVKSKFFA